MSWAALSRINYIFTKSDIPICIPCRLPVASYGLETVTSTEKSAERLRITLWKILGVSLSLVEKSKHSTRNTPINNCFEIEIRGAYRKPQKNEQIS